MAHIVCFILHSHDLRICGDERNKTKRKKKKSERFLTKADKRNFFRKTNDDDDDDYDDDVDDDFDGGIVNVNIFRLLRNERIKTPAINV